MDMEGVQGPQGAPELSPSPTMLQTPTWRSRRIILKDHIPVPEELSESDDEEGIPPWQSRPAWQETWSSRGSNWPAEDTLLEEGNISDEDSILSEDGKGCLDDLLDVERSLSEPIDEAQFLEKASK